MDRKTVFAFAALPLAFVLGGIVGAWKPTDELKALREAPVEKKAPVRQVGGFGSFAEIVNIPDAARHPRRTRPQREPSATPAEAAAPAVAEAAAPESAPPPEEPPRQFSPEDLQARIDEARELWSMRADVARAQLMDKFGLDDDGRAAFESAIGNMNAKLRDSMEAIASILETSDQMTPELGVRLMGDLSTAVAETYDEVGACVDPALRDEVSRAEFFSLIDPGVAEPLIRVQDKLGGGVPVQAFGGRRR